MDAASSPPPFAGLRRTYEGQPLREADLAAEPVAQFATWFAEAIEAGLPEPNAMVLATSSAGGRPTARTVLLKGHDQEGFVFYTNYESRKGRDLTENPRACLVFPWHPMRRQVRVEGTVVRLPREESAAYFHSRPYGSRIGAWASRQSAVVRSREELDERYGRLAERWPEDPPLPDFWGGFRVVPSEVEFWQGQIDRMHDRLRYRRTGDSWVVERLAP
ncbi:pyridoxine/pyridoxamine 5'-phosphate oxidase [Sphaerisporangium melleum]|uniref:Pyridoxine/pyridoxamine 5'-phosphate oxidase n=1 Tax=Sphaerisporangium melleum TaxID=321316 RepID=A0A917R889_9ACTN|nr:pyridoxamine 5'-phosphate oxidase [Sphaerisporangium melleum]GGK95245.1 pyridoxine/pyridoxamine 5'-phosphate oxidase [Sphaerisporangium melleum]GII73341.1 pyridoxine/pyridoxamine 5'-phosphate oxidase [Sphaerisporangium melleum]